MSNSESLVEELEYLGQKIIALCEAEDLSDGVNKKLHQDIVKLHRSSRKRLLFLARKILLAASGNGVY